MKICSRCHVGKPISSFGLRKDLADGLKTQCRSCNSSKHDKMPEDFYTQEQLDRLAIT